MARSYVSLHMGYNSWRVPEQVVMDWLGKLLGLPSSFLSAASGGRGGGCIQVASS